MNAKDSQPEVTQAEAISIAMDKFVDQLNLSTDQKQKFKQCLLDGFIALPTAILDNKPLTLFCAPSVEDAKEAMLHHLNTLHDPFYQAIHNATA